MSERSTVSGAERARRRAEAAEQDRTLLPLVIQTRPTCDVGGVMLAIIVDRGQRPYGADDVVGRLTEEQALGVASDLTT